MTSDCEKIRFMIYHGHSRDRSQWYDDHEQEKSTSCFKSLGHMSLWKGGLRLGHIVFNGKKQKKQKCNVIT